MDDIKHNASYDLAHSSEWGELFPYKGYGNCDSHCYVAVNGNVVICTEAPHNPGTSITNMAEEIALLVCTAYHIIPENLVWIEHYPERNGFPEDYDLVMFSFIFTPKLAFASPKWSPINKEEAMRLYDNG